MAANRMIKKRLSAVILFFTAVVLMFSVLNTNARAEDYDLAGSIDFTKITGEINVSDIRATGTLGKRAVLLDLDRCLTDTQEEEVISALSNTAKSAKCNVAVVITNNLLRRSDSRYTEYVYDSLFGMNSSSVVMMFLNTYNNPEYSRYSDDIYTNGKIDKKISPRFDKILKNIYRELGNPRGDEYAYNTTTNTYGGYDYYNACLEFARSIKTYGTRPLFVSYIMEHFTTFLGSLVVAFIITFIVVKANVSKYKTKKPLSAANYIDNTKTNVKRNVDQFVREYTTSYTRSSSSGGSHGGGGGGGGGGSHSGGHHR